MFFYVLSMFFYEMTSSSEFFYVLSDHGSSAFHGTLQDGKYTLQIWG